MNCAKWIWKRRENRANRWICFAKDFLCEDLSESRIIRIAADSKYWLYINGKTVLREGGLKRGRSPHSTYYDELEPGEYLVRGSNRITVLVWYFGKDGFSHLSSGRGGLYVEMVSGDRTELVSDESWKARRHEAFTDTPKEEEGPNFRLPESDIRYDAAREPGHWTDPGYDLSEWENADAWNEVESRAFGELVKRPIPLFRFGELVDFINSAEVRSLRTEEKTTLVMRLPENLQFTPFLQIDAPRDRTIMIRTESYTTAGAPGVNGLKCIYRTRDGLQAFESPAWMNGATALFELPAGITVHDLRYRKTEYASDQAGSFLCEDPFLNRLWEKCRRTLHLCMRDTWMDCPNRERAQWWGDATIEMEMAQYCMDAMAGKLYENGVYTMAEWFEATGNMLTVVPCGKEQFELPFQNLAGICGFVTYFRHTGQLTLIRKAYPMSRNYVLRYETDVRGLAVHRTGSWDWPDWGENADTVIMENAWLCLALDACTVMADLLHLPEDVSMFRNKAAGIRRAVRTQFSADGVWYHQTENGKPDDRANALAILAGFGEGRNPEGILHVLRTVENASPYMEKTVLEALCEAGRPEEALARMRRRYAAMTEDKYPTLWELWTKEASLNHGWSGGPLIVLSRYIAGIRAENDGSRYTVAPNPCGLKQIDCTAPTRFGPLRVRIDRDVMRMEVTSPMALSVAVLPPAGEEEAWTVISRNP